MDFLKFHGRPLKNTRFARRRREWEEIGTAQALKLALPSFENEGTHNETIYLKSTFILLFWLFTLPPSVVFAERLQPSDFVYEGAFRLEEEVKSFFDWYYLIIE